jgi:hypothetical protein
MAPSHTFGVDETLSLGIKLNLILRPPRARTAYSELTSAFWYVPCAPFPTKQTFDCDILLCSVFIYREIVANVTGDGDLTLVQH